MSDVPAQTDLLELDLRRYELRRGTSVLKLEKIPMELLILLVERRNQLVGREEIIARLWGTEVFLDTEQGINTAIRKIRMSLGDDPNQPRFLQTVVGKGYRFVGPIAVVAKSDEPGCETAAARVQPPEEAVAPGTRRSWAIPVLITGSLILAVVLIGMKLPGLRRGGSPPNPGIRSIAVLPLENLSGDPGQDYFADGISDALLTNLAQIHSLRVISRTSAVQYRGSRKSMPDIAKELNVDAVVEGTFSRSNDRVRVTAQLIQAATDRHIWAETYERKAEDILPMQSAIALEIAKHISAAVSAEEELRLSRTPRVTPDAQEAYFRGRYLMTLRGVENMTRAPSYFQLAIAKDANFADAYAGLAESYGLLVDWGLADEKDISPKLAIARKAVELDPESSTAHTAMALYLRSQRDRDGSESEIRRALELNPNNSTARKLYGFYLAFDGRLEEGINEEMLAADLDPLAAHMQISLGHLLSDEKQFDTAISHWQKALELDPSLSFLHLNIGWAYAHKGMREAAIREWSLYWAKYPKISRILTRAYERSGYEGYLRALLGRDFATAFSPKHWSHYQRAVIYAELAEKDLAFESLAKAIDEHDNDLDEMPVDPALEKLRTDSRFRDVVSRWSHYGLPAETSQ